MDKKEFWVEGKKNNKWVHMDFIHGTGLFTSRVIGIFDTREKAKKYMNELESRFPKVKFRIKSYVRHY